VGPQQNPIETYGLQRADANAARWVSVQSVVWTVVSSAVSIALGIGVNSAVLVAFGCIGLVDAVGSIALAYHFHHTVRHDRISDELERLAHRVVMIGLAAVGLAAIAAGLARLLMRESGGASAGAIVVATASLVALTVLSTRKRSISKRVSSPALLSDAHLSAIGAAQAAVALIGMAATQALDWHWADAVATAIVGCAAVILAAHSRYLSHRKVCA
jgi:divalent metal cation (Fe/Co/Zn/Cd) transporter